MGFKQKYSYTDFINKKFGMLTITGVTKKKEFYYFNCDCECGNTKDIRVDSVINNKTRSCGCNTYKNRVRKRHRNKIILSDCGKYYIGITSNTKHEFYFDLEDYSTFSKYYLHESKSGYLYSSGYKDKKILIHRIITNCPEGYEVDHINHNTLDNRKDNLRIVTRTQNSANHGLRIENTSGVTGVRKSGKKWRASLTFNKVTYELGLYFNIEEAIKARRKAEEKYFGNYSYNNSMKSTTTEEKENK